MSTEKPTVFISHSAKDVELARLIQQQLEMCIGASDVFASDIEARENWFEEVVGKLKNAQAFVALITPNSVAHSQRVWFELGYFWARHHASLDDMTDRQRLYYPLHAGHVALPNLVDDLRIHATSMKNKSQLLAFFRNISHHFGSTKKAEKVELDGIIALASTLSANENFTELDQPQETALEADYKSPYDGFPDVDLRLLLEDHLEKEYKLYTRLQSAELRYDGIFEHTVTVFEQFDVETQLPIGTCKKFLVGAMKKYGYVARYLTENLAMFEFDFNALPS